VRAAQHIVEDGEWVVRRISIRKDSFVGNDLVLESGVELPPKTLVAALSDVGERPHGVRRRRRQQRQQRQRLR
jgi:hypothetical protein